jgi:ferric-dicitrate binding protein FerR (iron transport regulator)
MMDFNLITKIFNQSAGNDDQEKLQQWIDEDSSHKRELEKIKTLWEESCKLKPFTEIDAESDWLVVERKISRSLLTRHKSIPLYSYIIRIAAIVILAVGLTFGLTKILKTSVKISSHLITYQTNENVKTYRLPDGSVVTLNINSSISLDRKFNSDSRDIILKGEAFFEVQHQPLIPFRVFTGNSIVEVTGTRFSILEDTSFIRVMVLSGSVSLQSSENPKVETIIAQQESGYIFPDNTLKKQSEINLNNISWKTGQLIFHKTPIKSALQDIAHHFHKQLSIDENLKDSLTAQFTNQPLQDILEEIRIITSLSVQESDNIIVVKQ